MASRVLLRIHPICSAAQVLGQSVDAGFYTFGASCQLCTGVAIAFSGVGAFI